MVPDTVSSETPASAWRSGNAHLRFWLVAGLGLVLDLWSKARAFSTLQASEVHTLVPELVEFRRSLNPGAVFGLGAGLVALFISASALALGFVLFLFFGSGARQRGLHIALGMILAGALGNLYDRSFVKADVVVWKPANGGMRTDVGVFRPDAPEGAVSLGEWPDGQDPRLIPAESVIARRRQGVVRDFVKIVPDFPGWVPLVGGRNVWPWVFNVADALLVCGVILLMGHFWLTRDRSASPRFSSASRLDGDSDAAAAPTP